MSPDTAFKKMARRRAGIALATVGLAVAAMPLTLQGATGGLTPGDVLPKDKEIPAAVKKALKPKSHQVIVAFVLPGITEDTIVKNRLVALQKDKRFSDTKVLIYRVTPQSKLGDMPEILDMSSTPLVAVFQRDGKIASTWRGLVDKEIIAQSVIDARKRVPHKLKLVAPKGTAKGNAAGIKLAKRVNAHYAKVASVAVTGTETLKTPVNQLTGVESTELMVTLAGNKISKAYLKGTDHDGVASQGILNRTGVYVKRDTMACWGYTQPTTIGHVVGRPMIEPNGATFGKPVKAKKNPNVLVMKVKWKNIKFATYYRIDAKTLEIISSRSGNPKWGKLEQTYKASAATPATPATPASPPAGSGTTTAPATPATPATPAAPATPATPATPAGAPVAAGAIPKPEPLC